MSTCAPEPNERASLARIVAVRNQLPLTVNHPIRCAPGAADDPIVVLVLRGKESEEILSFPRETRGRARLHDASR